MPCSAVRPGTRETGATPARTPRAARPCRSAGALRRPAIRCNFFQVHLLATTMPQGDVAPGGLHVPHPVHFLSQHGHEIALASNDGHDERQTDDATGAPARHLEGDQVIRSNPARIDCGPPSVENACHPIGMSTTVEPSLQTHLTGLLSLWPEEGASHTSWGTLLQSGVCGAW